MTSGFILFSHLTINILQQIMMLIYDVTWPAMLI